MSPAGRGDRPPFHNRIAVLRAERRMPRADLAAAAGTRVQSIGALERGDHTPRLDLALRICGVLELPVAAVFARTESAAMSTALFGCGDPDGVG